MSTVKSKKCSKCGQDKPLTEFHRDREKKDGFQYQCKSCRKERSKKYYQENRQAYSRYYEKNKEALRESYKEWYQENKNPLNESRKARYATNPEYRAKCLLRKQTYRLGDYKNTTTLELIGCSPKEFWKMNGSPSIEELQDLHIDHVVPMSWFDLSNEDHVKVCNHYLNLQYLNSKDNLEKNNRYAGRPDNILGYKGEFDVDGYVADILEKIKDLNLDNLK